MPNALLPGTVNCSHDTERLARFNHAVTGYAVTRHGDDDPDPENIQRADALVISATEPARPPAAVAAEAWERRPNGNGRLALASVRVWHEASHHDRAIADVLYEDVQ